MGHPRPRGRQRVAAYLRQSSLQNISDGETHAAIGNERLSHHPIGEWGTEKQDEARDVICRAETPRRRASHRIGRELIKPGMLTHRRQIEQSARDGVHVNALWRQFDAEVAPAAVSGLFYGGGFSQLGKQAVAGGAVLAYSLILTLIIGYALSKTIGFRIDQDAEAEGIDVTQHAESAYESSDGYGGAFAGSTGSVSSKKKEEVSA